MKSKTEEESKKEMIDYFNFLAHSFSVEAHRNNDLFAKGKQEAYELAAFELEKNWGNRANAQRYL